jgi:hypothetical protein
MVIIVFILYVLFASIPAQKWLPSVQLSKEIITVMWQAHAALIGFTAIVVTVITTAHASGSGWSIRTMSGVTIL